MIWSSRKNEKRSCPRECRKFKVIGSLESDLGKHGMKKLSDLEDRKLSQEPAKDKSAWKSIIKSGLTHSYKANRRKNEYDDDVELNFKTTDCKTVIQSTSTSDLNSST